MKTLAFAFLVVLGLTGCVVAPLEPLPAVYVEPRPVVVPHRHHHHPRHHGTHHRHRHWR